MASENNGALHPQHRRSAVAGISQSLWRRAVETAGDAGDRGLPSHRLPDLDVPADGRMSRATSISCRSRSITCSKARG